VINGPEKSEKEMCESLPGTDGEEKAALLLALCRQATFRNAGDEALALAESAKEIYDSLGATAANADIANAYQGISYSLKQLNRTAEAAKVLENAVAIYREDHYPFVDDLLRTQAIWYSEVGDWEKTLQCHLEAVTVNEVDGNEEWLAKSLFNVGVAHANLGNFPEAIAHHLRARAIFKTLQLVEEVGKCDSNIAEAYCELGQGEEAIGPAQRAYDVAKTVQNHRSQMWALYNRGRANFLIGDYDAASVDINDALYFATSGPDKDWEFIVGVEEENVKLFRHYGRDEEADQIERRLDTIREILG
jgi:tetratricopeptide (TPR) repeat protein